MNDHIALYRRYRPQRFADVLGQEHVTRTLANAIASGAVSHAYLFCGPRGSGKTTMARLFAKSINCTRVGTDRKGGFEPCGTCLSCREIAAGKSLDVVEIDAASHTGVDEVRELIEGVKFAPASSDYKVFIIDECHQLSKAAANALLKTLEEPPPHAVFILATTEAHKMIPTIVSRCQRFDFKRVASAEITGKLQSIAKAEGFSLEPEAAQMISWQAKGSFRDAESLLDSCISFAGSAKMLAVEQVKAMLGIVEAGEAAAFLDTVMKQNAKGAVSRLADLAQGGTDMHEFAKTLVQYTRQALLMKINPATTPEDAAGAFSAEAQDHMKTLIASASESQLRAILERFIAAENQIKYAVIPQLPLELAVVDLTFREA